MSRYNAGNIRQIANPFLDEADKIDPVTRARLLEQADQDNGGFLSDLFWYLDTPGAMARTALAGQNPLDALGQSAEERIDGRELNRLYGLAGEEDNWWNYFGGLGTEIVTDPLSLLSGPTKALTTPGKAAAKAGLLNAAPEILSKAYVAGKELPEELAQRASQAAQKIGRGRTLSATDVAGRPLIGRRAASRYGTLDDLVKYSDDPDSARQSVLDALYGNEEAFEAIKGQALGRDIGIGLPFRDPTFSVSVPGGGLLSDTLDAAGQLYRWSPVGRAVNALTNNAVGQSLDAESQMIYQGADAARKTAMADARRDSVYQAAKLFQEEPDVFTEEGNRALGRLIEKPTDNSFKAADDIWDSEHPAAREYREWWDQQAAKLPQEFTESGLRGATFEDPFISGYLPRQADGALQMAGDNNPSLGRVLRTLTSDQMRRSEELRVPGGRDTIAFMLSKDPFVAGAKRIARTDEEAAQHIAETLFGKRFAEDEAGYLVDRLGTEFDDEYAYGTKYWSKNPDGTDVFTPRVGEGQAFDGLGDLSVGADGEAVPYVDPSDWGELIRKPGQAPYTPDQMKQARYLAQLLHKLPDDLIKDVPLFGQHPVASISRYIEGRAGAKATVNAIYDSLSSIAATKPSNLVEGGGHVSLAEALTRVGARSAGAGADEVGARAQMRARLAQRMGIDPDKVNLSQISVPEDHVNRLVKTLESYTSPAAASGINEMLDAYTRAWKNGVLSWPSRIVRDLYSGAYSNWLEGAFDRESLGAARALMAKSAFDPQFMQFLRQLPRYSTVPDADLAARFYADLAATGLLDGSYLKDRRMIAAGGPIQDLLVGTTPETFRGAAAQATKGWGEHLAAYYPNAGSVANYINRLTETNPIGKAGALAGNLSDKINRMTGYLSLLKQGVDPMEAARRMKRAHVDYSSLTPIERKIRDSIFPFYAYTSRIFGEVIRQIAERPGGRYGQGLRIYERSQESGDEYVPEYMRSQFAAPIDPNDPFFGWLGIDPSLGTRFFTDVDLPGYDQLQLLSGDMGTKFGNVMMMSNPLARTLAELSVGRDFFFDEPINEASRSPGPIGKLMRAATGDENAGTGLNVTRADKLLDLVPFASRPARFASQLYDSDFGLDFPTKAIGAAVTNAGLGKLRDVSADSARQDAIRKLQRLARPYTRDITIPTIPKGMEASVPQTAQDALKLSREMQAEIRETRRRRREQSYNPFE